MTNRTTATDILNSSFFTGIGPATVEKLLEQHGEQLYEILDSQDKPKLLKSLSEKKTEALLLGWKTIKLKRDVIEWLNSFGLEPFIGEVAFNLWGELAIQKIKSNPYRLLAFMTWTETDHLALKLCVGVNDDLRRVAIAEYAAYLSIESEKHSWVTESDLVELVESQLRKCKGGSQFEEGKNLRDVATKSISLALHTASLISYNGGIQIAGAYYAERSLENDFHCRLSKQSMTASEAEAVVEEVVSNIKTSATNEQCLAIKNSLVYQVSCFHGGAGVGKTFTIKLVCEAHEQQGRKAFMLAMSARAANNLANVTQRQAITVARYIYQTPPEDLENAIVIIDDCSMVDLLSFNQIIAKLPKSSFIVLVGDEMQLPSIEAGKVFSSILQRSSVPCVELIKTHRQQRSSGIPSILHTIRAGNQVNLPEFDWNKPNADGIFKISTSTNAMGRNLVSLLDHFNNQVQVISPLKQGSVGTKNLNKLIHRHVHGTDDITPLMPIIFTVNTRLRGRYQVYNGQTGIVKQVLVKKPRSPFISYLVIDTELGELTISYQEFIDYVEPAYALTVHKVQGAEFDTIVIPIQKHIFIERSMIYTAFSRCKRRCICLVNDDDVLSTAISKTPIVHTRKDSLFSS